MGVFISRTGIDISMMVMNMQCQNSCVRPQARGWLKTHDIIFKGSFSLKLYWCFLSPSMRPMAARVCVCVRDTCVSCGGGHGDDIELRHPRSKPVRGEIDEAYGHYSAIGRTSTTTLPSPPPPHQVRPWNAAT